MFPSPLVDQFADEIQKFGRVLKWIKRLMPFLGILPVKIMLRLFRFSTEFGNKMVLPLLALFLGTGNQTSNVPSVLLERLFNDKNMRLWDYDPDTLLPNQPTMYTFPNLSDFYRDWARDLSSRGVHLRLKTRPELVKRDKHGVTLRPCPVTNNDGNDSPDDTDLPCEEFDEMVICCPADEAKTLLGKHATWREKYVLGGVKFFNDITITHSDSDYFNGIFETRYKSDLCAKGNSQSRKDQISVSQKSPRTRKDGWEGFAPMYYIHSYESDPDKIEMGFDCTNYQHQFREAFGENAISPESDRHVYQTIFLNDEEKHLWTWKGIDESKIIDKKWWHQFGHRWQHYLRVVPGMMFINGKNRTLYAGAWTMVVGFANPLLSLFCKLTTTQNMHEIACISGIAAAYRLGAEYEAFDDFAEGFLAKYLLVSHGVRYKRSENCGLI